MNPSTTPFILVFRPHQTPAWAEAFFEEADFVDNYGAGAYCNSCNADPHETDYSSDYAEVKEHVGHDLHALTRLDSAEEVQRYLADGRYAGHHNRGTGEVYRAASELGWLVALEEEECK